MRWVLLVLVWLAQPLQAQAPDVNEVMLRLAPLIEANDADGVNAYLSAAVREARAAERLDGDWGVVFAMFSDQVRLSLKNPAYALRLAEEGLELVAASANPDPNIVAALNISRAYALADLGRRAEAAEIATLALPAMRQGFGEQAAADLQANAALWAGGAIGADNLAAEDLALQVLDEGYHALRQGDNGAALTYAARALLLEDSGLDAAKVRAVNLGAAALRGQALFMLGRTDEATAEYLAAAAVLVPDWQTAALRPGEDARGWEVFFWLGRAEMQAGKPDLARLAFDWAAAFPARADDRLSMTLQRVFLAQSTGQPQEGEAILLEMIAQSAGQPANAAVAAFYLARLRADMAPDWPSVDAEALISATETMLAFTDDPEMPARYFFLGDAAQYLVHTDRIEAGLDYARRAIAEKQTEDLAASALQAGKDQAFLRQQAEAFLLGSNRRVVEDARAVCPNEFPGQGCAVILPVLAR